MTTNYHLKINFHKITKYYVFLEVCSQVKNELEEKNKLWIDKLEQSESISFGIFYVCTSDITLINKRKIINI